MKKIVITIISIAVLTISATACQLNVEKLPSNSEKSIVFQMQEHRLEYVGDNSGVSKLLSLLPQFDSNYTQNMFAIQTNVEPYGLVIFYEPMKEGNGEDMNGTEEMRTYAGYLFDCIDNLGYVKYEYRITPSNNELEESAYTLLLEIERPQ